MSPTVAAMVQLQRITGMRPSEVYRMTIGSIDKTRDTELWYYTPKSHKTERFIGEKPIPLGKPEQELIAPYLDGEKSEQALFSPRTAMQEWYIERRKNRQSIITPSQQERDNRRAKKPVGNVGEFYDENSYRKAIENRLFMDSSKRTALGNRQQSIRQIESNGRVPATHYRSIETGCTGRCKSCGEHISGQRRRRTRTESVSASHPLL